MHQDHRLRHGALRCPEPDPDHAAQLVSGLVALRRAIAVARDPLTEPAASLLPGVAFRALPRPRSTGAAKPAATAAVTTITAVGPPPESPEADAADRSGDEPDEAVKALVARAQAGDGEAFGELYDRYVDLVYRYVYYRVGSQALAEDLTSEAFLRALRRITSFTWQGRDIGAWFITIARNLVADHFKSGRYRMEVATADMLDADRAEDGPEGAVIDSLTNATLLEAVKQLGAEQQECVVLRFLQGLSVAETALAMGKNEGAIKALQYRAVRALGRLLPEDML
ncbi:MAG: sigma-70 family RNA polymerase sigma factor [Actinomycetes bacterium]